MENDEKKVKKKNKKKQSAFAYWWKWPLTVLVVAFCLSLGFSVLSELALSGAGLAVAIVVIVVFISIAILTDMIGVAVTAASLEPFRAMAAKKVRGAKESIKLIQNADRVSSIIADVVGDICGILSGAAGATVAASLIFNATSFMEILIASLVSATIASLTIFGKAFCKKYAISHSEKIIFILGKFISLFHPQRKKNDKKIKKQEKAQQDSKNEQQKEENENDLERSNKN